MKKIMLLLVLFNCNLSTIFAEESAYKVLEGLWNAESDGEMDIILNVDAQGIFDMSIISAFEYTNMTIEERDAVIAQYVMTKGHFKVLNTLDPIDEGILIEMEVLLNEELTTNIFNLLPETMLIYTNNQQEVFMRKKPSEEPAPEASSVNQ